MIARKTCVSGDKFKFIDVLYERRMQICYRYAKHGGKLYLLRMLSERLDSHTKIIMFFIYVVALIR